MKITNEVHRKLFIGVSILMLILMSLITFKSEAQVIKLKNQTSKEYHQGLQKQMSWENYQNTYKDQMMKNAKETRKVRREQEQADKMRQRFFAKLERIKKS